MMKKNILLIIFVSLCAFAGMLNAGSGQGQGKRGYRGGRSGHGKGGGRGDWAQKRAEREKKRMEMLQNEITKTEVLLKAAADLDLLITSLGETADVPCEIGELIVTIGTGLAARVDDLRGQLCDMQTSQSAQGKQGEASCKRVPGYKFMGGGKCRRKNK